MVNLHLLNDARPMIKNVNSLIKYRRAISVDPGTPNAQQPWKESYIMGDFNLDILKNKWNK